MEHDRFDAKLIPHSHLIAKTAEVRGLMIPLADLALKVDPVWDCGHVEECRLEFRDVVKNVYKIEKSCLNRWLSIYYNNDKGIITVIENIKNFI